MRTRRHSLGYNCTKRNNLGVLSEDTVCYVAGNYVIELQLQTKQQRRVRSASGGAIGALAVHPRRKWIAVAEKGHAPSINVFEWPSLRLYRQLRGGAELAYAHVAFSPNGKLLASVGGDPDYLLVVWNWRDEQIVLRTKAFSQDVFRVSWAAELEGQLTTGGSGHIRFWKMARTFTGLKLHGAIGKFGRTEISDIEGFIELPDGKVLSSCEWGNMLLWEGGLIKVEIARKNRKRCHVGPIQQLVIDEGELMSVGSDGHIRVWDLEAIDNAEATDESGVFELEPMNELRVAPGVALKCMIKCELADEVVVWYAQVRRLDTHTTRAPTRTEDCGF